MGFANKSKVKWALFWNYLQKTSGHVLKFLIGITLARLLDPAHFGLIAMVSVFTSFSNRVIGLGLSSALIQKKEIDDLDCNTVFYTNLALAISCYAVLFASAPYIAEFYNEGSLVALVRVCALNLILNAISAIQFTLISKELKFKSSFRVSIISAILGGATSIGLAYYGLGVWALVAGTIMTNSLRAILLLNHRLWRPTMHFSLQRLQTLLPFGGKVTLLGVIEVFFSNLHTIVIGRLFNASTLGFYARANSLQQFAATGITEPLQGVIFPALSKVQDKPQELKTTHFRSLEMTVFLVLPAMLYLSIEAHAIVSVLLGTKWLPAAPLLQISCGIGSLLPIRHHCSMTLKSVGRVGEIIKLQTIGRTFSLLAVIITYRYGIKAMMFGEVIATGILVSVFIFAVSKQLESHVRESLSCMAPYGAATLVSGLITHTLREKLVLPHEIELVATFISLSGIFLAVVFLAKTPLSQELTRTLASKVRPR